jgi:two-component system C4-dicarboxylate transport response regulator DctD
MSRLLIVDDEPVVLELLSIMVSRELPEVVVDTVGSPEAALGQLARTRYDAIVTDIVLSHASGLELMDRMLALSPGTPVILMTGLPALITPEYMRRASGVLTKPFLPSEFRETVRQALQQANEPR